MTNLISNYEVFILLLSFRILSFRFHISVLDFRKYWKKFFLIVQNIKYKSVLASEPPISRFNARDLVSKLSYNKRETFLEEEKRFA